MRANFSLQNYHTDEDWFLLFTKILLVVLFLFMFRECVWLLILRKWTESAFLIRNLVMNTRRPFRLANPTARDSRLVWRPLIWLLALKTHGRSVRYTVLSTPLWSFSSSDTSRSFHGRRSVFVSSRIRLSGRIQGQCSRARICCPSVSSFTHFSGAFSSSEKEIYCFASLRKCSPRFSGALLRMAIRTRVQALKCGALF